jgi:hypothetical protein
MVVGALVPISITIILYIVNRRSASAVFVSDVGAKASAIRVPVGVLQVIVFVRFH